MKLFSNQKAIRIIKTAADKENIYGIFNKDIMYEAMRQLTPSAFKLWCYLGLNQNGYEFGLSFTDVHEKCGISRSTYYDAVKELEEKNYLVKVQLYDNLEGYLFVEAGN